MALASNVTRHHAEIPALDGFRAIAIGIVILSHVGLQHIVPGQFGVTLFFFLSGYLITTLLRTEIAQHGRIDFRRFYLRRAVRIMPPMYVTIAFVVILSLAGLIRQIDLRGLPFDLLFLTNYYSISGIPIGLWSLAVEEHFYLAFPLYLALLTQRFGFAKSAALTAIVCAVILAVRIWEVQQSAVMPAVSVWSHTRVDSLLYGSILALWNNPVADDSDVLPKGFAGYALGIAILLPTFLYRDEVFRQTLRYSVQGLGLLVLFNTAIRDRGLISQLLNNVVTRQIAILSYSLYLVHSAVILAFMPNYGTHPLGLVIAAFACSVGYALLMHRLIETPLTRWRRRTEANLRADSAEPIPAVVKPSAPRS